MHPILVFAPTPRSAFCVLLWGDLPLRRSDPIGAKLARGRGPATALESC